MGFGTNKSSKIKITEHEFSFDTNDGQYLDVKVHAEGYVELKIETTDSFIIESEEDLDLIYQKLKSVFKQFKQ